MTKMCTKCQIQYEDCALLCNSCGAVLVANSKLRKVAEENRIRPSFNLQGIVGDHSGYNMAVQALEKIPLLKKVVSGYLNWWLTPKTTSQLLGHGVELSKDQIPEIHSLLISHCDLLKIDPPRIFLSYRDPLTGDIGYNAYTFGTKDQAVIFLSSSLVDHFTLQELSFVLAHECGHISQNHVVYLSIGSLLQAVVAGGTVWSLPFLFPFIDVIKVPLLAWSREAEYLADQIALELTGDIVSSCKSLFHLVVGSEKLMDSLNLRKYLEQGVELESFYAKLNLCFSETHPYTVHRVIRMLQLYQKHSDKIAIEQFNRISQARAAIAAPSVSSVQPVENGKDLYCEECGFLKEPGQGCPFCDGK